MAEYIERGLALSAMNVVVTHANAIAGNSVILQKVCGILEDCKNIINDCPAADVAPVVHGRWEAQEFWKYENKHSILYKTNRCSLCHYDVSSRLLYNYCPNCGARMDGE